MSFKDRMRPVQPKIIHLPFKQLDPDRAHNIGVSALIMILPTVRIERPEPVKPKGKPMKSPRQKLKSLIRPMRTVLFIGIIAGTLAARLSALHAETLPEYTLKLTPAEVEQIGTAILELPMRVAAPLQAKLRQQAGEQEQAAAAARKAAADAAPKPDAGGQDKAPE